MRYDGADAKPGEPQGLIVDEQRDVFIKIDAALCHIGFHGRHRFVPERAGSFLASFAVDEHRIRTT